MATIAAYLPESMLIRVGPDLDPFVSIGARSTPFKTAQSFGFFFHEYAHYLHNVSTFSGIVLLLNTIELWRHFRLTFDESGFCAGSSHLGAEHQPNLEKLIAYLDAARGRAPLTCAIQNPASLKICSSRTTEHVTTSDETMLTKLVCSVQLSDHDGNTENCSVQVGTHELLEGAAWLLEKHMVETLDPTAFIDDPPFFPYKVAAAIVCDAVPASSDLDALACMLAALQSSDAVGAFADLLAVASKAAREGEEVAAVLRTKVTEVLHAHDGQMENAFKAHDEEFSSGNVLAVAVREVLAVARRALDRRKRDPFFELDLIKRVKDDPTVFGQTIGRFVPCHVLQVRHGDEDQLGRDHLVSFRPQVDETLDQSLRVLHCIFHLVSAHRAPNGFRPSADTEARCPFYTCCKLRLRTDEPEVCRKTPWR